MYKISYIQFGMFSVESFDSQDERDTRHNELTENNKYCECDEKALQITVYTDKHIETGSMFCETIKKLVI